MKKKYLGGGHIYYTKHRVRDFHLLSVTIHVRDLYQCGRKMLVANSMKTSFWEDA
jgi:hypothetical protein